MNKTEKRKEITKRFLTYITEQFPQYEICDDGDGGRMYFYPESGKGDDLIEYHRSNGLCTFNWASEQSKQDCLTMENKLDEITLEVEAI
jgi:hypothetical protein